jgi:hypothetical protein
VVSPLEAFRLKFCIHFSSRPCVLYVVDFIILIIYGIRCKLCDSSLCNFLQRPITSSFYGPNILVRNLSNCVHKLVIPSHICVYHVTLNPFIFKATFQFEAQCCVQPVLTGSHVSSLFITLPLNQLRSGRTGASSLRLAAVISVT